MSHYLIVNADDYGLSRGVSRGIRQAHTHGIVTTTTAIMNMPGALEDVCVAADETPTLDIGVHLVLTTGRPVRPPEKVASIVTKEGRFPDRSIVLDVLSRANPNHLRDEWRAQIEHFLESDQPLDHLDSHHHISYLNEQAFEIMLGLSIEYGVPVRSPLGADLTQAMGEQVSPDLVSEMAEYIPRVLAARPMPHPNNTITHFFGAGATKAHLLDIIASLPPGVSELMCHPGEVDDGLRTLSRYTDQRAVELSILTDSAVREALEVHQVVLLTFTQFMFSWARERAET